MDDRFDLISPPPYDWTDFDPAEFRAWLEETSCVYDQDIPYWMRAIDHRAAWTLHIAQDYQSPKDLVRSYVTITQGCCAWVSPEGDIFTAEYAGHDNVAQIIIGRLVGDLETEYARVSIMQKAVSDAFLHVIDKPSRKMKKSVENFISGNICHFRYLKDW